MKSRWVLAGMVPMCLAAAANGSIVVSALPAGVYQGGYACAQGVTALRLTVQAQAAGQLAARVDFGGNSGLPHGAYLVTVRTDGNGDIVLTPLRWIQQPPDYGMVGARLRQNGRDLTGTITDPACGNIALRRTE